MMCKLLMKIKLHHVKPLPSSTGSQAKWFGQHCFILNLVYGSNEESISLTHNKSDNVPVLLG